MKSPVSYYLLLLYVFALCKPVTPMMQDMIAHIFFEHQHVSSVHQSVGKDHVSKEVGKLAEDETSNNSSTNAKAFDSVPLHLATSVEFHSFTTPSIVLSHSNYYIAGLSAIPQAIQLPPPRT